MYLNRHLCSFGRWVPMLAAAVLLAGCGNALLLVREGVPANVTAQQASVYPKYYRLAVIDNINTESSSKAGVYLYETMAIRAQEFGWLEDLDGNQPNVVTIRIEIAGYQAGSQVARAFLGGDLAGKGQANLVVSFEVNGEPAGQVDVQAEMTEGFFGGSQKSMLSTASKEIFTFMVRHF